MKRRRKQRHVAGPDASSMSSERRRKSRAKHVRLFASRFSTLRISNNVAPILHNLWLLEKWNLESYVEFLPRPCGWAKGTRKFISYSKVPTKSLRVLVGSGIPARLAPSLTGPNTLGVTRNSVSRWETGDLIPPKLAVLAAEYLLLTFNRRKRKGEAH
jgi:hypothetical protein